MSHNCAEHFERTRDIEVLDETAVFRGNCTECGQELTQIYDYTGTVDSDTGEFIDRLIPEHIAQIHTTVSKLVTVVETGEWQRAVDLQHKVKQQLHALVAGEVA